MKKITLFILLLLATFVVKAQTTCTDTFSVSGQDDGPTVLTINAVDIVCNGANVPTSMQLINADGSLSSGFCDTNGTSNWYSFTLQVDANPPITGCSGEFNGVDITGFSTLTITSQDNDAFSDGITITIDVEVTYPTPACTSPVATPTLVEDCGNNQFSVNVDITDLGDATSVALTNDGGVAASTGITSTGVINVGPFSIGTPVNITLVHEQDSACNVALGSFIDDCPIFSSVDCAGAPVNTTVCYGNNEDLKYTFTSSDGSALVVDFIEGYFEDCCDDIIIYDGLTTSDPILFQSDTNFGNSAAGITATSTGDSILVQIVSDASVSCGSGSGSPDLNFDVFCNTCTPPSGSVDVVEDCAGSGGFNIEITLSDLGSSTSFTLSDDQGSPNQNVNTTGTYTFGPYTNGTLVTINVDSDQDANCSDSFSDLTQIACPPSNDNCANAISLTPGLGFDDNPVVGTNLGATDSGELPLPGCASYDPTDPSGFGGDVWYAVTVPVDGNLTIQTNANPTGTGGDSGMAIYSGSCGSLVLVECDDDDSPDGAYSQVVIEPIDGLSGQVVYARVWEFSGNAQINFQISAFSASLSTDEFDISTSFKFYPNPVTNTLNLEAQKSIEKVTMYNMLGQTVLTATPNAVFSEIDMSALHVGAYFVKVSIDGATKTVRVIKQ